MDASAQHEGAFHWNGAGWFGSQIGSTIWMLILASVLFAADVTAGVVTLAAFIGCNALGLFLWGRRGQRRAYPSIQLLIGTIAVASLIVFVVTNMAIARGAALPGFIGVKAMPYWLLIVFPAIMLQFCVQERVGRSAAREPAE